MAEEEKKTPDQEEKPKTPWQIQKESWYDKLPVTLKQMDIIVAICWILLAASGVLVYLDAADIFHLFG